MPDGRAANQPFSVTTFNPPIGAPLPGALVSVAMIFSPARSLAVICSGDSLLEDLFLLRGRRRVDAFVHRGAELARELLVQSRRDRGPLRAVISAASSAGTMPSLSVVQTRAVAAQEGGARAFLAAEAERAVEQPVDEPFEADRNLDEPAAERCRHAIDHAAADDGLPDRRVFGPARRDA